MLRLDELYLECIDSLQAMTDEEFDLFNRQAIHESRDSFLLGDLDEDETETAVYSQTPTQRMAEPKTVWAQGMAQSCVFTPKKAENRYEFENEAA